VTVRIRVHDGRIVRLAYRLLAPVIDARRVVQSIRNLLGYPRFLRQAYLYARMEGAEPVRTLDLWPCLGDAQASSQGGGGHYFYQDVWALRRLASTPHELHVDIGSRIDGFVGQATALKRVIFVDIRPVRLGMPHLMVVGGDVLSLPFRDRSVRSLSCLNVIEHVGLGRYGEPLNPKGTELAARELTRVLACGGDLYVSTPVGRPALYYNAHRILGPAQVRSLFGELELVHFAGVDDSGRFHASAGLDAFEDYAFGLGLFHFARRSA
jgi:hypothetical protein